MARDIKVNYDSTLKTFDIKYQNSDLEREEGITTAVLMSLFTNKIADDSDNLKNEGDKQGWWGDLLEDGDNIGSRLWLLDGKTTQEELELAKIYIKESLQWMIEDDVCQKIDVTIERQGSVETQRLAFQVDIYYSDGNKTTIKFKDLWEQQFEISL